MGPTEKQDLQIEEEQDGSAFVQVPESELPPEQLNTEGAEGDEAPDDSDPDREQIRAARREERQLKKQIRREKVRESGHLISALRRQNAELAERVAVMERKTSGAELARMDKAIEDAAVQVEYSKMKMRDAVTSSDGDALTKAQEMWYEAQRKLESLNGMKQAATRPNNGQAIQPPNPNVQRMARDWMSRNEWYDPEGKDLDSEIATRIDKKLTEEGYDPTSEEYWEELDARVQKYLPHLASGSYNTPNRSQRPRSMVASSGRESIATTKSSEFRLSPDRVAAMREAGLWDNVELRNKTIRKYMAWDRQNSKRG